MLTLMEFLEQSRFDIAAAINAPAEDLRFTTDARGCLIIHVSSTSERTMTDVTLRGDALRSWSLQEAGAWHAKRWEPDHEKLEDVIARAYLRGANDALKSELSRHRAEALARGGS